MGSASTLFPKRILNGRPPSRTFAVFPPIMRRSCSSGDIATAVTSEHGAHGTYGALYQTPGHHQPAARARARGSMLSADRISSYWSHQRYISTRRLTPPRGRLRAQATRLPCQQMSVRCLPRTPIPTACTPKSRTVPSTAVASYHLPTYPHPLTSRAALGGLTSSFNPCGKVRLHSQLYLTPNPNPNPDPITLTLTLTLAPNPNPNA